MDREFKRGALEIPPDSPRFANPLAILRDALRLFTAHIGLISAMTLLVYIPGHLLYQIAAAVFDVPSNGILSILLLEVLDIVLSALAVPAVVYGLLRRGRPATIGDCMRWGTRQWMRTLSQQMMVEVTVTLYAAMLIVPGVIAMVRLIFVPVIVAVEGDTQPAPLQRSRELANGRGWRIFAVFLPLTIVDLAANFLLLDRITGVDNARVLFALAESGIAIVAQLGTVAALLMYLGTVEPLARKTR
jgi:hypothetical protein